MITAFTTLNDVLFSEMIHPTYTYGEEGYVFFDYTDEIVDHEFIESFANIFVWRRITWKPGGSLFCIA